MFLWLLLAIVIIVFDQVAKWLVVNNIGITDSVKVIPGVIDFVYVKNTGAAFSFLSDKTYGIVILTAISLIFCAVVVWYVFRNKPQNKLFLLSLALMFSGAVGNVIDRISRGYVVDFIETTFIKFPVFNVADIAITVGAVLLVIYILFFDKNKTDEKTDEIIEG